LTDIIEKGNIVGYKKQLSKINLWRKYTMIKRYLLIGVVSVAGLLIVAAIITGNTNFSDQQKRPALSESTANIQTAVPKANNIEVTAAKSNAAKAVLDVQGMSCSGCINEIKSSLAGINGVGDVLVDLNSGRVEVFYDSSKVKDLGRISAAITAVGYPASLKQTLTKDEVETENRFFTSRSKLYIAAAGEWEISRQDFDAELLNSKNRYKKVYGNSVFTGDQGDALLQRLQSQIASGLISEGIQMQEVRKAGFKLPAKTVEVEFDEYLAEKGITQQEFKKILKDSGYDYSYFYKKFENRLTIDHYLNDKVLAGLSNDLEKKQRYSDWYNNASLLAKVVYYDKNLETIVKNSSAGGGCGTSCSTKQ
jgi:copper chaperone